MNHLLLILSFIVSLITTNPIVDSSQLREKDETIGDSSVNYCVKYDSIKLEFENKGNTCQAIDKDCLTCESCCNNPLNLLFSLAEILIAIVGLIFIWKQLKQGYKQAEKSNQQSRASNELAQESYKSFKTESERQHKLQQETLKAIIEQTDKLYSTKQKSEIVDHFASCYSLVEIVYDYLLKHFGDVVRDTKEYSAFVFDTLRTVAKDAGAIQMLMGSEKFGNEDFSNALDICTGMMNLQINNQNDMDDLLERLAICKKAFENQKNAIDKELEENE